MCLNHIRKVNIELFTFLNRTKYMDGHFKEENVESVEYIDKDILVNFLTSINNMKFGLTKVFQDKGPGRDHRPTIHLGTTYEPLYDYAFTKAAINIAKNILSDYVVYTCETNGDYLSKDALDGLRLNSLIIRDQGDRDFDYWLDALKESGVVVLKTTDTYILGMHRNIGEVRCFPGLPSYSINSRRLECIIPIYNITLNYNGKIISCPYAFDDEEMIIGDMNDNTLYNIYNGIKSLYIRDKVYHKNNKLYPSKCKFCENTPMNEYIGYKNYNYRPPVKG